MTSSLFGQTKEQDITKLMKMTGSDDLGMQVMFSMVEQFKQILPDVPAEYWDAFFKEVSGDDLINLIVPIYSKHFTHEEILAIIAFYETPTGRKMTEKLPVISEESMMAGQQWGMEIAEKLQKKLTDDGYLNY
jgi:uncharacterized protein